MNRSRSAQRPAELWTGFAATAENAAHARHLVIEWLRALDWPVEASEDIVLAVYEALANVVDHAYLARACAYPETDSTPGTAQLYTWEAIDPSRESRRVVAVVTDHGRWKPALTGRRYRGRGLPMMAACMDEVHIQPSAGGTTVIMTSLPVAGPDAEPAAAE
jgi:anti-sigma regulatory factor (Ser/Thr protein kinase)